VLTSTDPIGAAGQWKRQAIDGNTLIWAVSCPSASLCVAGDEAGDILSSTNPTAGPAAWRKAPVGRGGIGAIWCASIHVCVAGNGTGQLLTSTNPRAGPTSWKVTDTDHGHWIAGLTCAGPTFCVATDNAGNVLTTDDPAAPKPTWTRTNVDGTSVIWDVSCPSSSFCVAGDVTGSLLTGSRPNRPSSPDSLRQGVVGRTTPMRTASTDSSAIADRGRAGGVTENGWMRRRQSTSSARRGDTRDLTA
jgi:hypothetical protein